jgi:hypothetical protein
MVRIWYFGYYYCENLTLRLLASWKSNILATNIMTVWHPGYGYLIFRANEPLNSDIHAMWFTKCYVSVNVPLKHNTRIMRILKCCYIKSSRRSHYTYCKFFLGGGGHVYCKRPPLWSSGQTSWLQYQRSRFWYPALPDFLSSGGPETGLTQPPWG